MPVYDVESMNITAGALDRLAENIRASKADLTDFTGENPFGDVEDPDTPDPVAGTLGSFAQGIHDELDAAAHLVSAAGGALRDAVAAMIETDAVAADNLTWRDQG